MKTFLIASLTIILTPLLPLGYIAHIAFAMFYNGWETAGNQMLALYRKNHPDK